MPERRPIVGGNWKMNQNRAEARALLRALLAELAEPGPIDIVVCPPAPWLGDAADLLGSSSLSVGAQHTHWEERGAFTGEQSASLLRGTASHVLVGHSERRQLFGERDEDVARRLGAVLAAGLTPILAVGERLEERRAGHSEVVLERQLLGALRDLAELPGDFVVAYEPVWAIGSSEAAPAEMAGLAAAQIRSIIAARFGAATAGGLRIQYGGSVSAANAASFAALPDVDGALVGGASLRADEFAQICREFARRAGDGAGDSVPS